MRLRRWIRKPWHLMRVGGAFVYFWLGGAYLSWIHLPLVWWRAPDPEQARARCRQLVVRGWQSFLGYIRVVGIATFEPEKVRPPVPDGPFVLVANHPTLVDVIAVMTSIDDLYCVVKGFYYRLPMIHRLLRYCGHIDAGDAGPDASARVLDECLARLREGGRILFFPEGTRSPVEGLHPFQRGAFEVARRGGVPIVPAVLRVSQPVLKRGVPWYHVPDRLFHYEVRVLEPRRIEGGRSETRRAAEALRQEVLEWLETLDGVPFDAERGKGEPRMFPLSETLSEPQP